MTARRSTLLAASAITLFVSGCSALSAQSDPTKYFVLTPIQAERKAPFEGSLGIGPIKTPDALEDYLVTRLADEEISISETDRWSESLREELGRVLRQNLITLLGTERVSVYPWEFTKQPDLAVRLEVQRFEQTTGGMVNLSARWSIERGSDRTPLSTSETNLSKAIAGNDTRAAVSALSSVVGQLSVQIAAEIRRLSARGADRVTTSAPAR
jgi:uncharacterized lipoprotein YmbA